MISQSEEKPTSSASPALPEESYFSQIRTGVDLVPVQRIATLLERYGTRFTGRVFTEQELEACNDRVERMASRFAAKEAVSKAFGTGIGPISWREIEIVNDHAGRPGLRLSGRAAKLAQDLGLSTWTISLSHTEEQAIAFVIAVG